MDNNGSGGSGKSSSTNVYLEYIKSMKTAIFFVAALAMLFLAIAPIRATQAATFKGDSLAQFQNRAPLHTLHTNTTS